MKILVTGGAGFIGSNLIELLLRNPKFEIHSLDNYDSGTKQNEIEGCNYHVGDIESIGLMDKDFDVMGSVSLAYRPEQLSEDGFIHYDRWAFKFHTWHEEFSIAQEMDMRWFTYWKPPIGAKPIKCLSVFGGLAIYKMEAFLSGIYGHKHPEEIGGFNTVEHAQFHYTLHKNKYNKIYLNPSQRCIV